MLKYLLNLWICQSYLRIKLYSDFQFHYTIWSYLLFVNIVNVNTMVMFFCLF